MTRQIDHAHWNFQKMSAHVVWHHATVTRRRRAAQNGHHSAILWFTGLSGAGKSTIAHATEEALHRMGCRTFVFDGDHVRHGLCADLGFSSEDRRENIRRIGEMSKLFTGNAYRAPADSSCTRRGRRCDAMTLPRRLPLCSLS